MRKVREPAALLSDHQKQWAPLPPPRTRILPAFKPLGDLGIDRELAAMLSSSPQERTALIELFRTVKQGYEAEVRKAGKSNNTAGALTFFIATCVVVHNQAPEPSDAAAENLFQVLNDLVAEAPESAQMSDREKQAMHDRLIYLAGLVLAGYSQGVQQNNAELVNTFRALAGVFLRSLLNIDAGKVHFTATGMEQP